VVQSANECEFHHRIVAEPCAGDGWIERVLVEQGYSVVTGDVDESAPVDHAGLDILSTRASKIYGDADIIISNPPYSDAPRIVRRCLEITPRVAMLLRLTFLEPCEGRESSKRVDLLKKLDRVIVLPRVSFYQGKGGTDSATCAWFIWETARNSTPRLEIATERDLAEAAGQLGLEGVA
jgi:hypothetical protein